MPTLNLLPVLCISFPCFLLVLSSQKGPVINVQCTLQNLTMTLSCLILPSLCLIGPPNLSQPGENEIKMLESKNTLKQTWG